MSVTIQEWKSQLETLPVTQRAELARFLIETLDQEEDPDAEAAWETEITRRVAEIKSGQEQGVPAEEVFAKLREKYS